MGSLFLYIEVLTGRMKRHGGPTIRRAIGCMALLAAGVFAAACQQAGGQPPQENLQTPQDNEVVVATCPLKLDSHITAGSLGTLLPADPRSGELPKYCSLKSNDVVGAPDYGFFALKDELERLGRVCGCDDGRYGSFHVRIDQYLTTSGAHEAFGKEAGELRARRVEEVEGVDEAQLGDIGDERIVKQTFYSVNGQVRENNRVLLMRRRNIIARMETPIKDVEVLLEYAAQLDKNIQAAAPQ